jgi:D-methionine transport system ATP-binding protein
MIKIEHLSKTFVTKAGNVEALKDINLEINDGDIFGIIGMSGAGKSTLVRCINMLERPTEGRVVIDGTDMNTLSSKELREQRRNITMIFQSFNLLMQRTNLKNVCFPLEIAGVDKQKAKKRAMELLDIVGLADKADVYPAQLSGGQQQRVAIARALATDPKVLLCDEATSALDPKTTNQILDLIKEINEKMGITVIVITHQMSVVEKVCNRVAIIDKGEVKEQGEMIKIFSDPQSAAAKRLVNPDRDETQLSLGEGMKCVAVSFNSSETTDSPLIATLAMEKGIPANIMYASTKNVGGKAYGKMLLGIPDSGVHEALEFMNSRSGITATLTDVVEGSSDFRDFDPDEDENENTVKEEADADPAQQAGSAEDTEGGEE